MKTIIVIRPEDTGKRNFSDIHNCPFAQALKRSGFVNVQVGGYDFNAEFLKKKKIAGVTVKKERKYIMGKIPDDLILRLEEMANERIARPVESEIEFKVY